MIITEAEVKSHIQTILDDTKSYSTSLNYAVNYCRAAMTMTGHELKIQVLYILSNITHWRNPKAAATRAVIKEFIK